MKGASRELQQSHGASSKRFDSDVMGQSFSRSKKMKVYQQSRMEGVTCLRLVSNFVVTLGSVGGVHEMTTKWIQRGENLGRGGRRNDETYSPARAKTPPVVSVFLFFPTPVGCNTCDLFAACPANPAGIPPYAITSPAVECKPFMIYSA